MGKTRILRIVFLVLLPLVLLGCRPSSGGLLPTTVSGKITTPTSFSETLTDSAAEFNLLWIENDRVGLTHQQSDGNRLVGGRGSFPDIEPLDIPLPGRPVWLVGVPLSEGSLWVAILEDGQVQAFEVHHGSVTPFALMPPQLPPEMPPIIHFIDAAPVLLTPPTGDASPFTHPIPLPGSPSEMAYLSRGGEVVFSGSLEPNRLAVDALPDGRLLSDGSGRILLLSGPSTAYPHGVLGDSIEASSITLLTLDPRPRVLEQIPIPPPDVIEGIAPIWADLTGDGVREIILTLSNAVQGARIVVFDEAGSLIADGPAIGTGFRWRHQLAVAPFGPNGELELASVQTPHTGGVVEFFRLEGSQLKLTAWVSGYSSHLLGSRNLDRALAGDLDGDGRYELLVPDQAQQYLGAIQREGIGAGVEWSISMGGELSTNLAGMTLSDGSVGVGAGRMDNTLRLWLP